LRTRSVKEKQMTEAAFDTMARGLSRRASLATLGAAGLLALANPMATDAKKKKKAKDKCKQQTQQCIDVFTPDCAGDPGCVAGVTDACQLAGLCEPLVALLLVQTFLP
jgi:hypothetical protein